MSITVSAQNITNAPCHSDEEVPVYLRSFMNWALSYDHANAVTIKREEKKDSVLAVIEFNSFKLQSINNFLNINGQVYAFSGLVNGKLKVTGSCQDPYFSGNITISDGYYQLTNFGEQSLEDVEIDTNSVAEVINRFDFLHFDVNIKIKDHFYVRNERFLPMKVRLSGTTHLSKQVQQNMQLNGKLKAVGGYVKPLGTKFRLVDGFLKYTGKTDNPVIHLTGLYQPHRADTDIKIWYRIRGTIVEPVFNFSSNPPMDLKSIFSYTLFARPFYRLDSIEQGLIRSIAAHSTVDYTAEVLLDRMEILATQKLSVDVVRIDNTTAESGTVLTTGWYLNPKVFFAIQNVIAGKPKIGFYLEYYLTEELKLIFSQDNDYGQAVDLQYEYNY